jgi:hypothetical protein
MQSLKKFIRENHIRMTAEWADENPHMADPMPGASHYKCKLKHGRRSMTVFFSMGSAHTGEPEPADVLDCLASDASGAENASSFEDWCSEYGYDTDSRKAEKTYRIIERQAEKLKNLLGGELYNELLWKTERL